ncbi:MAG: SCP2 domain-containing protein [Gammaproteobacteria bacterium]
MTGLLQGLLGQDRVLERIAEAVMRVLRTDSLASARLASLAGRVIAIRVDGFDATFYAAIDADRLLLATGTAREPDVMLSGRLTDFASFARARQEAQAVPAGRVQIQGDLATAQAVQRLLDELDIDWEALLARRIGDVAARQVGRGLRHGIGWLRDARAAWLEDVPAFLTREQRWVPSAEEIEQFARDGMTLGSDVDRLAARIARLRERAGIPPGRDGAR